MFNALRCYVDSEGTYYSARPGSLSLGLFMQFISNVTNVCLGLSPIESSALPTQTYNLLGSLDCSYPAGAVVLEQNFTHSEIPNDNGSCMLDFLLSFNGKCAEIQPTYQPFPPAPARDNNTIDSLGYILMVGGIAGAVLVALLCIGCALKYRSSIYPSNSAQAFRLANGAHREGIELGRVTNPMYPQRDEIDNSDPEATSSISSVSYHDEHGDVAPS
ncbi:MAG: hypothetical protein Q7V63_05435 [Gammaproteobacteria bacterium]|nr:hypothetical protein [Gammaproteobacteria bacterium]